MRHKQLSSLLINSLYELNDVEFQLSQRGQDLDDNWPSFSKKAFGSSPQPMGYSTYATDLGSLTPRAFTVDSADGSMDTQDIAKVSLPACLFILLTISLYLASCPSS
jgi:hypothetical protein